MSSPGSALGFAGRADVHSIGCMKIAAVQMVSTPRWADNRNAAARLVGEAAAAGAGLVLLPEYFCLMGMSDRDKLGLAEAAGDVRAGSIQGFLSALATEHGLWLVGGTLPVKAGSADRVLNRCCVFGPDGQPAGHYDKVHLFAFDNGRESYDEGRVLEAGSEPVAVQAGPLRVGLSVCYDLRFPELYRSLMAPPCDVLCVPAAFTHTTGEAHWELLLRARAVENQCYVLASAQGGRHANGRRTWGHSMVVGPWGEVLDVLPEGEGFVLAEVDAARVQSVRTQLPALRHRKL
jgi:deaminated glutathione amidase